MKNAKITFVVFTYNEAKRIERVIRNFQDYGIVLIADDSSTDETVEIAKKYGCDIYIRDKFKFNYVENQPLVNELYKRVKTEWIYWAFADEILTEEVLSKLIEITSTNKYDIINIDRKNYFYGEYCYDMFHSRLNRCFRKGALDFSQNKIHGFGVPTVSKNRIYKMSDKYFVHHLNSYTLESYISTLCRYIQDEAYETAKVERSIWYVMYMCLKYIIKHYFFLRGYKARFAANAYLNLTLMYYLSRNIKRYETVNNIDGMWVEEKNNCFRDKLLKFKNSL